MLMLTHALQQYAHVLILLVIIIAKRTTEPSDG